MPLLYTLDEAAALLGVSTEELRGDVQGGAVRGLIINGAWKVWTEDVHKLARDRGLVATTVVVATPPPAVVDAVPQAPLVPVARAGNTPPRVVGTRRGSGEGGILTRGFRGQGRIPSRGFREQHGDGRIRSRGCARCGDGRTYSRRRAGFRACLELGFDHRLGRAVL